MHRPPEAAKYNPLQLQTSGRITAAQRGLYSAPTMSCLQECRHSPPNSNPVGV